MKRFMLASLISCMFVGQVSCDGSWQEYGKGCMAGLWYMGKSACMAASATVFVGLPVCSKLDDLKTCAKVGALVGGGIASAMFEKKYDNNGHERFSDSYQHGYCDSRALVKVLGLVVAGGFAIKNLSSLFQAK